MIGPQRKTESESVALLSVKLLYSQCLIVTWITQKLTNNDTKHWPLQNKAILHNLTKVVNQ